MTKARDDASTRILESSAFDKYRGFACAAEYYYYTTTLVKEFTN